MKSYETDVLVVGGGPAGIGAAMAAARTGAKTIIVEQGGMLGGTWTQGLQNHVTCMHDHRKFVIRGIMLEILNRLHRNGDAENPEEKLKTNPRAWWVGFDPEGFKWLLDVMLLECGAKPLLHAFCMGTLVENGNVRGAVIMSKSGRQEIRAKVTIDCSGDADVAFHAGATTFKGREQDGRMQPVTTAFFLMNVDYTKANGYLKANPGYLEQCEKEARAAGKVDIPQKLWLGFPSIIPNATYHNITRILNVDATEVEDLTRGEIEGRKQVRQMLDFYRKYIPGYENARILSTGSHVGLRETRRIEGEYTLGAEDVMGCRSFEDAVACHAYYIDLHNPEGLGTEEGSSPDMHPEEGKFYQIPYRCLVPRKIDNLLVAGRCISATRHGHGSTRTTACCTALGQAAGIAASLCAKDNLVPRKLNYSALRAELENADVYLG